LRLPRRGHRRHPAGQTARPRHAKRDVQAQERLKAIAPLAIKPGVSPRADQIEVLLDPDNPERATVLEKMNRSSARSRCVESRRQLVPASARHCGSRDPMAQPSPDAPSRDDAAGSLGSGVRSMKTSTSWPG